ncbi:hypothetical protein ACFX2I_007609 [Malus domestica]
MEQNFYEPETHFVSVGDVSVQKWNSISSPTTVSDNDTGSFECNICLDSAHEPVVTLCGHLYCWPCIYKWLQVPTASDEQSHPQQTCPVCKANITPSSVVPLYGRGLSSSDSDGKKPQLDLVVPHRPPPMLNTSITATTATSVPRQQLHPNFLQRHSESVHDQYYPAYGGYATNSESAYLGGTTLTNLSNPTIGMVGEFVFERMFGSSNTNLFTYPYPNSYTQSSHRMRRQEVELDRSLNRVTIFLFCCFMLCLLLF